MRDLVTRFSQLISQNEVDIPTNDFGPDTVARIMVVVFSIIGGVTLIIIILSGFSFILSQGNPDKVAKARNTILYAAIGLAICVSGATIVNFISGRL